MILGRFTSFILVLYVLVLLTQPCQDVFARPADSDDTTGPSIQAQTHPDSETESETCSPFCICSCCSVSAISCEITFAAVPEANAVMAGTVAPNYESPYAKTFRSSIWQPPKA